MHFFFEQVVWYLLDFFELNKRDIWKEDRVIKVLRSDIVSPVHASCEYNEWVVAVAWLEQGEGKGIDSNREFVYLLKLGTNKYLNQKF